MYISDEHTLWSVSVALANVNTYEQYLSHSANCSNRFSIFYALLVVELTEKFYHIFLENQWSYFFFCKCVEKLMA